MNTRMSFVAGVAGIALAITLGQALATPPRMLLPYPGPAEAAASEEPSWFERGVAGVGTSLVQTAALTCAGLPAAVTYEAASPEVETSLTYY